MLELKGYTLSDEATIKLRIIVIMSTTVAFSESGYDMSTYLSGCVSGGY
jgi:hypothetical protein